MSMDAVQKLIQFANSQVGYLEKETLQHLDSFTANAGNNNYTKYARDLDALKAFNTPKNGYDWCQVFVVWNLYKCFGLENALKMLYLTNGGDGAGCTQAANHYKANRAWTTKPKPGHQIFFTNGKLMVHTGLVERVANGYVFTIEGNTSGANTVVSNGGGVKRKQYPLSYNRIAGYGVPNWSVVDQKEDDDMTGEEIYRKLNEYTATLMLPEWAERDFNAAIAAGITDGTNPMGLIPRYQAAIMAYRAMRKDGE